MITSFLGHLHPVLLHLPIGVFSLAFLLFYVSPDKSLRLSRQLGFILFLSWITAMISAGSGLLLNTSGEYNEQAAETHQWSAIVFTILCGGVYFLHRYNLKINQVHGAFQPIFIAALIAMVFTGHAGGSLTHGADFLWPEQEESEKQVKVIPVLSDTSAFTVYDGLVQPLLASKCENCHKAGKQKGGLRMDDFGLLLKGGKNGKIIQPGDAASSEMMVRILLPEDDDKHMPPKGKQQLSEKEVALLHWWIAHGADHTVTIREVSSLDTVSQMIEISEKDSAVISKIPMISLPDSLKLATLIRAGFTVRPLSAGSGWLEVTTVKMNTIDESTLQLLTTLSPHIYSLSLAGLSLTTEQVRSLTNLNYLKRLDLRNTRLNDAAIGQLIKLEQLEYLNLVGTVLTDAGLQQLQPLTQLKNLYCWNTWVTPKGKAGFTAKRPETHLELGY
jgi:uncharacterized membrane protein/mono/diheme cytochrome c family protein